ncbi:MAG: hypothetical protein HY719_08125 [Planctomycetes bacterium]|nr:hypothetical protein [Planctomycetota bacterium]
MGPRARAPLWASGLAACVCVSAGGMLAGLGCSANLAEMSARGAPRGAEEEARPGDAAAAGAGGERHSALAAAAGAAPPTLAAPSGAPGGAVESAGALRVSPTAVVEVWVDPGERVLGSYDLTIAAEGDGGVLAVADVTGPEDRFWGPPTTDAGAFDQGRARLVGLQTNPYATTGRVRVARVLLRPVAPGATRLTVTLRTATDTRAEKIEPAAAYLSGYHFTVTRAPPGGVTGDMDDG